MAALASGCGITPAKLDDQYICYILSNWLEAGILLALSQKDNGEAVREWPRGRPTDAYFKLSGLKLRQTEKYYFIANAYKGGAFRIYFNGKNYIDSGVEITHGGKNYITNILDMDSRVDNIKHGLEITTRLKEICEQTMPTALMLMFKSFQLAFGSIGPLQKIIKKWLRVKMVSGVPAANTTVRRSFVFKNDSIEVTDVINQLVPKDRLRWGVKSSYNFIPSSKYFEGQEARSNTFQPVAEEYVQKDNQTILKRRFQFN